MLADKFIVEEKYGDDSVRPTYDFDEYQKNYIFEKVV